MEVGVILGGNCGGMIIGGKRLEILIFSSAIGINCKG